MDPQESTYELVGKPNDDEMNMEKNPAYSVQDTSMLRHYDFITDKNNQNNNSLVTILKLSIAVRTHSYIVHAHEFSCHMLLLLTI